MTVDELIELIRGRKWRVGNSGAIRCEGERCPLIAAYEEKGLGTLPNICWETAARDIGLDIGTAKDVVCASDNVGGTSGQSLYIREKLLTLVTAVLILLLPASVYSQDRDRDEHKPSTLVTWVDRGALFGSSVFDSWSVSRIVSPNWRPHPQGGWVRYSESHLAPIDKYCPCPTQRQAYGLGTTALINWGLEKMERSGNRDVRGTGRGLRYVVVGVHVLRGFIHLSKVR